MHSIIVDNNGYIAIDNISRSELDLDKTLNCGQTFRWHKDYKDNWVGVVDNSVWVLKQYNKYITTNLRECDKERLINYFNLDIEYTTELSKLKLDSFAKLAYESGKGIHILRQNLFETMVTFLMSQCNTMHNIRNIINKLCRTYGREISVDWNGEEYKEYTFPTLEKLYEIQEHEFKALSMGFRAGYLASLVNEIYHDTDILSTIRQSKYTDAIQILCNFNGIGIKVANCISLFALHHTEAFPVDTHMQKIIDEHYGGIINIQAYGKYAGIIQQYMYYYQAFINT